MRQGETPSKRVRITAYDLLVSTNRQTNNLGYERLKAALDRLSGTRIKTNIKTNGIRIIENFGLIDAYGIIEKSPTDGRMIGIQVKISDWLYNAVCGFEVLTLNRDYFRLRKPMERRIYELARKHCGTKHKWSINLNTLKTKIGTTAPLKKLRFNIRRLIETNHLPDYMIDMDKDIVTFSKRKGQGRNMEVLLSPDAFEKVKLIAPGHDVYDLEREWREWGRYKREPKDPDAAFLAFCRGRYQ
jgi:plasmid replication initiation protein